VGGPQRGPNKIEDFQSWELKYFKVALPAWLAGLFVCFMSRPLGFILKALILVIAWFRSTGVLTHPISHPAKH
jgi:hypothetical protein